MLTARQKKRALNRMYYQVHKEKVSLQKHEKYATNSEEKKAASHAYSKTSEK